MGDGQMMRSLFVGMALALGGCSDSREVASEQAKSEAPAKAIEASVLIDVPSLVGSTKEAIDAQFGTPECPPKNACIYADRFEVFYVDGLAANVTLPPIENLQSYGFDLGEPTFVKPGVERWTTSINGRSAEISDFGHYVYVKTAET